MGGWDCGVWGLGLSRESGRADGNTQANFDWNRTPFTSPQRRPALIVARSCQLQQRHCRQQPQRRDGCHPTC